jgi:hypothetical protein
MFAFFIAENNLPVFLPFLSKSYPLPQNDASRSVASDQ